MSDFDCVEERGCDVEYAGRSHCRTFSCHSILHSFTDLDSVVVVRLAGISCPSVKNGISSGGLSGIFPKTARSGGTHKRRIPISKKTNFLATDPKSRRAEAGFFPPESELPPRPVDRPSGKR